MTRGSPFAPHTPEETAEMLEAVGADDEWDLFDVPEAVRFDGEFGIEARSEADVLAETRSLLEDNDDLTEFLGRGHYDHYVPSAIDHLADRSEFLTSYTQYQPEVAQGFLQALFEYQSMLVELTGLPVANASMYDAATALGEAALLASRVDRASGDTVLLPEYVREERVSVLENYGAGADLTVETVATADGTVDREDLASSIGEDTVMVYAESPTTRGTIEDGLEAIGDVAHEHDALFTVGSDPVALALLQAPADLGADVVVGDASTLGIRASYGTGLGMFATTEDVLRQVPGRLVGASEDDAGKRAYTLTLQTREQHIRRERATSNICTNQAWVALRTAMHVAHLGPDGLLDLARKMVRLPATLADRLDGIEGVTAPVDDAHHFREFVARTDRPAESVARDLETEGFAVHVVGDHEIQVCVTETNEHAVDDFVAAVEEVHA